MVTGGEGDGYVKLESTEVFQDNRWRQGDIYKGEIKVIQLTIV